MVIRLIFALLFLFTSNSWADTNTPLSPIGSWQTTNEDNQPTSIIKISVQEGTLVGHIVKLLPASTFKISDVCTECPEYSKNQPILGLMFLWGFVSDPKGGWTNGKVLDPHNGHVYKGTMKISADGNTLQLRGYWGPLWKTQTWSRAN